MYFAFKYGVCKVVTDKGVKDRIPIRHPFICSIIEIISPTYFVGVCDRLSLHF